MLRAGLVCPGELLQPPLCGGSGGPGARGVGSEVVEGVKVQAGVKERPSGWGPERGRRRKTVPDLIFPEPGEKEKAQDGT